MNSSTVFYGALIHSLSLKEIDILPNGVLVVDQLTGTITHLERDISDLDAFLIEQGLTQSKIHKLVHGQFIVPGFVDTHAHAPQYTYMGCGMDLPLLEWLDTYTFPVESTYASLHQAETAYTKAVSRFLRNGTTTCSWFATVHLQACQRLTDIIEQLGQRAYIGKVNMDQNAPDFYIETTHDSLENTRLFIDYVHSKKSSLLTPVITPRFAINCSSQLMHGLSALAKEYNVPVQSHLCENHEEIKFTCSLFPDSSHYTAIYRDHGLLSEKSYMAHCVHMEEEEVDLLVEHATGVSHCANSNFSLHSGVCDVRRFLEKGIKVGLGTDVAGGFSPSVLDAMRSAFMASKTIKMMHQKKAKEEAKEEIKYEPLCPGELFYLATLGGAQVLGLEDTVGNFAVGKAFDALWVDLTQEDSPIDVFDKDTLMHMFEKFIFNGNDRAISHVYVQGRRVSGEAKTETQVPVDIKRKRKI
ncbi:guanine deaminase [Spinellus fusiger]|nr:guanine deaminase [Spinellus fusiger]